MDPLKALEAKGRHTVERYGMLTAGDRVVAAVSGGPDSVATLLFLKRLAGGLSLDIHVFHLDHMFRGLESALDARFVERLAGGLGLPCRVMSVDVPSLVAASGSSPQVVARVVRLREIMSFADEVGADRVAIGHTADDQVETFLMRVIQGAGLTGLAGIRPVSGRAVRPLIDVWRQEVEDYCRELGVEPRRDSSNESPAYLRNRVRMRLVPYLVGEFGPGVKAVILREVESLAVDHDYVERQAVLAFERVARVERGEVRLDIAGLGGLEASVARGVIRRAWTELLPGATNLGWRNTTDILEKVAGGATGARLDLPFTASVEREYGELVFGRAAAPAPVAAAETVELSVPGSALVPGTGFVITAREVTAGEVHFDRDTTREFVRSDVDTPLQVRTPRPGDRFRPLGSPGSRKLSDFFTDIKLPRRLRATCPLVLSGGRVVWVAGHRLDERFAVPPGAAAAIRLRLHPCGEYDGCGRGEPVPDERENDIAGT